MKTTALRVGVIRVRHPDVPESFNLSVVEVFGVKAVRAFRDGEKRPRRGRHLMQSELVLHWIDELQMETQR